jgi:GTP1/Obg family GTP-binding protein
MRASIAVAGTSLVLLSGFGPTAAGQQPRRTEEQARQTVARQRAERERLRLQNGVGPELITSYLRAMIQPVPDSLGVDPFYTKYVDADGIPVLASNKVGSSRTMANASRARSGWRRPRSSEPTILRCSSC